MKVHSTHGTRAFASAGDTMSDEATQPTVEDLQSKVLTMGEEIEKLKAEMVEKDAALTKSNSDLEKARALNGKLWASQSIGTENPVNGAQPEPTYEEQLDSLFKDSIEDTVQRMRAMYGKELVHGYDN